MSSEISGSGFRYIIDTSYGINLDGFIAIGTESIVYKGIKIETSGGLRSACVLKFKPRWISVNGTTVDRLQVFRDEELSIFEDLQECRSIVRIYDVIENIGDFSIPCSHIDGGVITNKNYFCVVEEYIDGWSLEEYCRSEYWKLRKLEDVGNNLKKIVEFHEFTPDEQNNVRLTYYNNYDNILKYQNEIILFMRNLCEILEFITEKKMILHLDIKPENVMVTKYGKELVLIDFGRSKRISDKRPCAVSNLIQADYSHDERIDCLYQYGTLGYSAPESYAPAAGGSVFPFGETFQKGVMFIESDIFAFGTTFWECLNIFDLVTKSSEFSADSHDFYRNHFLNDAAYCSRDLSLTSVHYHKKLEEIIKKCTRKREGNFTDTENKNYYHSYSEIKKDINELSESVPTIVRSENVKVRSAFGMVGKALAVFTAFVIITLIYRIAGFRIASDNWEALTDNYQSTQFFKLNTIAMDLIKTAPDNRLSETYSMVANFTYASDGDIDEQEAALLISMLNEVSEPQLIRDSIDEIMQYANTRKFKEISGEIMKLDTDGECDGLTLAKAVYNAEVKKTDYAEAFDVLCKYKDSPQFRNAAVKIKNILDNDNTIGIICDARDMSKEDIKVLFKEIGNFT